MPQKNSSEEIDSLSSDHWPVKKKSVYISSTHCVGVGKSASKKVDGRVSLEVEKTFVSSLISRWYHLFWIRRWFLCPDDLFHIVDNRPLSQTILWTLLSACDEDDNLRNHFVQHFLMTTVVVWEQFKFRRWESVVPIFTPIRTIVKKQWFQRFWFGYPPPFLWLNLLFSFRAESSKSK